MKYPSYLVLSLAVLELSACHDRASAPSPAADPPPAVTTPSAAPTPAAGSAATATPDPSPCTLVTKAEAETILGEPVRPPEIQQGACVYFLVTPKPDTLASIPWISITRTHGTRENFDGAVKVYGTATPETGLGDHAVSASHFLFVYKGDNILSIQPGNTAIPAAQVRAFAVKALERI